MRRKVSFFTLIVVLSNFGCVSPEDDSSDFDENQKMGKLIAYEYNVSKRCFWEGKTEIVGEYSFPERVNNGFVCWARYGEEPMIIKEVPTIESASKLASDKGFVSCEDLVPEASIVPCN